MDSDVISFTEGAAGLNSAPTLATTGEAPSNNAAPKRASAEPTKAPRDKYFHGHIAYSGKRRRTKFKPWLETREQAAKGAPPDQALVPCIEKRSKNHLRPYFVIRGFRYKKGGFDGKRERL